jgi:predicted kinase
VLCGLPAAGKSTWAATNGHHALVLSADVIREHGAHGGTVFARMEARAREALLAGLDVVIDACSLAASQRGTWRAIATQTGARTELVFFCTPFAECMARNARRERPAIADWQAMRAHAQQAVYAVQREGWGAVQYVPRLVVAFAYS